MKILVIGDDSRSFLSVIRSLGQQKHSIHVVMHRYNAISASSKYINVRHTVPPVALNPKKWLSCISSLNDRYDYDFILPCDDSALIPFMQLSHSLDMDKILHPGERAFDVFYDKQKTLNLCRKFGVPIAENQTLPASPEDISYPVALKPTNSFTVDSLSNKNTVIIIDSYEEAKAFHEQLNSPDKFFLENYFDGLGVGISVLAHTGKVTHAFQHERMEEGVSGGSSLRKAVPLHAKMVSTVKQLAEAVCLNGVAMFEFRYNKALDKFVLLEVNARFWGSLPLAIYAGIDFPAILLEQYSTGKVQNNSTYEIGKISRALTASFYDFARNLGEANSIKEQARVFYRVLLKGIGRTLVMKEKVDSFSFVDLRPFRKEVLAIISLLLKGTSKRLGLFRLIRKFRSKRKIAWLKKNSPSIRKILILCYGNICRSPFAEKALKQALNQNDCIVESAGFHMVEKRQSPDTAILCSSQWDIDLSTHKSAFACADMVSKADLILYFDERNEEDIKSFYSDAFRKSVNMGDLLNQPQDIADPYGYPLEGYEVCYEQISHSVRKLVETLRG